MGFGAVAAGDGDVELGVAPHAVFVDVEAAGFDGFSTRMPQSLCMTHSAPKLVREAEGADREQAECLDAELVEAAGVDEAAVAGGEFVRQRGDGEEAGGEGAPDAGHAVHGDGADRVVDLDPLDEDDAEDGDEAGADADHDRRPGRDEAGGGGDRDQGAQCAVEHHRDVGFAEP